MASPSVQLQDTAMSIAGPASAMRCHRAHAVMGCAADHQGAQRRVDTLGAVQKNTLGRA